MAGFVLCGAKVDVKIKNISGFKEVVDECACRYATAVPDRLLGYRKQASEVYTRADSRLFRRS